MGQLDTSKNPWEVNLSPTTSSQSKTLYTGGTILDRDIKVTVDGVGQTNLTAANIKNGVTVNITNGNGNIYSVTGTHAGEAHSAASTGTSASGTKVSTITPGTTTQYVNVTAGATDAKYWEISGSSNLTAANIKKDVTIFGVTGTYNNEAHSSYTPSSTYFQDSNSSGVASTTAVIEANKYATKAYYLKAGTAGAVSGGGLSGSNVTLGDTNNGIAVTRADASYSITTAGWISNAGSKLSSGSKYISAMTIPENVTFNGITMTAGTIGSDSK